MTDIMNMNWGGSGFPSYEGRLEVAASAPPAAAPSAAPSSGAPAASPTATPATPPASPAGTGAPPATPTGTAPTNSNADNIAVLRQSHENLQSLGVDFATAKTYTQTMQKLFNEASTLSQSLEYTPESLKEAWADDPVGTLQFLRTEAAKARSAPRDPNAEALRETVRREVAPLQNFVARQQAEQHNRFIDSEFNASLDAHPVFKTIKDPDVRQDLHDRFIETVKWNNGVLKEVMEGKSSGLKKVFDEVANNWLKTQAAYTKASGAPVAGAKPGATPTNGEVPKDWNLDDIIEGTDKSNFLPSMRGFR